MPTNALAQFVLDQIIRPALVPLPLPHPDRAAQLLLGTAAHESMGFRAIHQIVGPALSIFQIEPRTLGDLIKYASARPALYNALLGLQRFHSPWTATEDMWKQSLQFDHVLAAAFARIYYYRVPTALPPVDDIPAQALYWKTHYNTKYGKGTVAQYIKSYGMYCKGVGFAARTYAASPPPAAPPPDEFPSGII